MVQTSLLLFIARWLAIFCAGYNSTRSSHEAAHDPKRLIEQIVAAEKSIIKLKDKLERIIDSVDAIVDSRLKNADRSQSGRQLARSVPQR